MTNTSSNSGSSRRANALNSATAAHLAILSASPYSPPTNMSGSHYSAMLSAQSSQPRTTLSWSNAYPNSTSTSYASGSSTRTTYYNHPLTSSSSPLNRPASIPQTKSNPPVIKPPDYLANTNFAELYYKAHEKDGNDVDKDLLENVALPTEWNVDDRCSHLSVDSDRLKVNYIGSGKNDTDAAAIRANHSMPPQCGLFYFEIDIISKGKDGYIGIGFCAKQVPLNRLPGWENDSWGYHGDDGHSFCCSGSGKPYGPGFTTGDTIGCCLNFRDGTAFYTKNGKDLGIAFRDLKGVLYPSIGLRTQGESVEANFGHRKFKFAIEHYMKEEKTRLWNEINSIPMDLISSPLTTAPISQAASEANLTSAVHHLILSYLVHHGYSDTAKTFSRNTVQLPQVDNSEMEGVESENPLLDKDKDMINRQRIRDAVLSGDIDHAIKLTNTFYPSVLPSNRDILFQLRCRKFIEMLGACAGTEITLTDHGDDVIRNDKTKAMIDDDIGDDDDDDDDGDDGVANESNEEESEDENDDDEEEEEEEFEDAMDVDEFAASTSDDSIDDLFGASSVKKKTPKRRKNVWSGLHGLDGIMAEALKFGYELQDDYRDDYRDEIKNTLKDAFSLLAYTDPRRSCVSHLLDPSGREPVANSLNSAILVSQGKPAIPPLEKAYRQASVVLRELSRNGVGSSAFVNVRQDCLV